jgi:hypothetical protein
VIWGPMDGWTNQRTNIVSYRGATSHLKIEFLSIKHIFSHIDRDS